MSAFTNVGRVAVVGAGIIGASVAAALTADGVETTVVAGDQSGRGPVSRASLAWVNARSKAPEHLARLNADARRRYAELAPPWFIPSGARADGIDLPDDGWVDTAAGVAAHLATVRYRRTETVTDLATLRSEFDAVVVAAGAGTAGLVSDSPRLTTTTGTEGYLVRIAAEDSPVDRILSVDGLQLRPDRIGHIAAQSLRAEADLRERGITPTRDVLWPRLRAEIGAATGWTPSEDAEITIDRAHRTHPVDGLPVVGWVDGVYVVVAHSGVTLAPLLAELTVRDLRGDTDARLIPFRP